MQSKFVCHTGPPTQTVMNVNDEKSSHEYLVGWTFEGSGTNAVWQAGCGNSRFLLLPRFSLDSLRNKIVFSEYCFYYYSNSEWFTLYTRSKHSTQNLEQIQCALQYCKDQYTIKNIELFSV